MKQMSFALAIILLLTACSGEGHGAWGDGVTMKVGNVFEGTVNNYEGVSMTAVEGTAQNNAVTVEILNSTTKEILSGNAWDFGLQVKQEEQWYWLERGGSVANTAEAYCYPTGEAQTLELAWDDTYGTLAAGHYRVTKWFFEQQEAGENIDFLLSCEFTLE